MLTFDTLIIKVNNIAKFFRTPSRFYDNFMKQTRVSDEVDILS
jgi:hypothetical protein